jgi:hypothetical protein
MTRWYARRTTRFERVRRFRRRRRIRVPPSRRAGGLAPGYLSRPLPVDGGTASRAAPALGRWVAGWAGLGLVRGDLASLWHPRIIGASPIWGVSAESQGRRGNRSAPPPGHRDTRSGRARERPAPRRFRGTAGRAGAPPRRRCRLIGPTSDAADPVCDGRRTAARAPIPRNVRRSPIWGRFSEDARRRRGPKQRPAPSRFCSTAPAQRRFRGTARAGLSQAGARTGRGPKSRSPAADPVAVHDPAPPARRCRLIGAMARAPTNRHGWRRTRYATGGQLPARAPAPTP